MSEAANARISRRRVLGTALASVAGSLLPAGLAGCLAAKPTGAVDTSSWKTYCVGRFLIKLPAAATTRFSATIYQYDIVWRRDLTPETAKLEVEQAAEKYGSQLIATYPLPGGGIVLHRWNEPYSTTWSKMDCYFVSQDDKRRVFLYKAEVGVSSFKLSRQTMEIIAKTLYARDHWDPIPTEPGFAFEGGFVKYTGKPRQEDAVLVFKTLPPYLGIKGNFRTYVFAESGEQMFGAEGAAEILAAIAAKGTILRKGDVKVDGIAAQEICVAHTEEGKRKYDFTMKTPGEGKNMARPMIILDMSSDNERDKFGNYKFGNGFASDAEAVEVWNALRDSIRLRPGAV